MRVGELRSWLDQWPEDARIDFGETDASVFAPDYKELLANAKWKWDEAQDDYVLVVAWQAPPAAGSPLAPPVSHPD